MISWVRATALRARGVAGRRWRPNFGPKAPGGPLWGGRVELRDGSLGLSLGHSQHRLAKWCGHLLPERAEQGAPATVSVRGALPYAVGPGQQRARTSAHPLAGAQPPPLGLR